MAASDQINKTLTQKSEIKKSEIKAIYSIFSET